MSKHLLSFTASVIGVATLGSAEPPTLTPPVAKRVEHREVRHGATVIGLASEPNHSWLKARDVIPVEYGAGVADRIRQASGGKVDAFIDTFGDGYLYSTPRLTGAFGKAGADIMLTPQFGVGGETDFRFSQGNYAGLRYRPTFYDFNAIWMPKFHSTRFVPELEGGLGAVHLSFYENQQYAIRSQAAQIAPTTSRARIIFRYICQPVCAHTSQTMYSSALRSMSIG